MRYIPLLRPAGHATLPEGLQWSYVEAPAYITARPDLPRSRHPHGLIETARPLTAEEIEKFDLRPA
jgi:Defence against restriction A C-terminal